MADAAAVAITSVVVAGVATISAPLLVARLETQRAERRFAAERRVKDLDELRTLIDKAASHLHDLDDAAHRLWDVVFDERQEAARDAESAFWTSRWTAERMRSRLAIRLGTTNAITKAYLTAVKEGHQMGLEVIDLDWITSGQPMEDRGGALKRFMGREKPFRAAIDVFLNEAEEQVGSTI